MLTASLLVPPVSKSLPNSRHVRPPPPPVVCRSPIASGPELSPCSNLRKGPEKLVFVLGDAAQLSTGHDGALYSQSVDVVIPNAWTVDSTCLSSYELNIRKMRNLLDLVRCGPNAQDARPLRLLLPLLTPT
ncbi:hypothetical protein FPV67DRAFT_779398 [Lyophyllum atratum]|nr:hypothetical protein FPV67DRAFT_779398 [Lyophyllum atratum]